MHYSENSLYTHVKKCGIDRRWTNASTLELYREYLEEDKDKPDFLVICPIVLVGWLDTEEEM